MSYDLEYTRIVAILVVGAMGERAPDWVVESVYHYDNDTHDLTTQVTETVRISLRSESGKYESVSVYFVSSDLSLAWSTIQMVDGIQDHAVEATNGEPLPPCPGHRHPLVAQVVDGVPKWVCMKDGPSHYARDILPNFDPAFNTPEEYLALAGRSDIF